MTSKRVCVFSGSNGGGKVVHIPRHPSALRFNNGSNGALFIANHSGFFNMHVGWKGSVLGRAIW